MKGIIVRTDNSVEIHDFPKTDPGNEIRKVIGGWMEFVYPKGLPRGYVVIIDEEGKLKGDNPKINWVGSYWYGTQYHGDPLVGDLVVMRLNRQGDLVGLTQSEINFVQTQIPVIVPVGDGTVLMMPQ